MNNDRQQDQEDIVSLSEEAHYHHVINDFIGLIEDYGFDKVINDFRRLMGEKQW